jgi:hypothetical protein
MRHKTPFLDGYVMPKRRHCARDSTASRSHKDSAAMEIHSRERRFGLAMSGSAE